MKKMYFTAAFYAVLGLIAGVFYREFVKINSFEGITMLSRLHVHILALGFLFFLIVLLLERSFKISALKFFKGFYFTYNIGLLSTVALMAWRGILQVNGATFNGLNHIAGTAHAILGAGFIFFLMNLYQAVKES